MINDQIKLKSMLKELCRIIFQFMAYTVILCIHSFCVILITICLRFMFLMLESGLVGLVQPMLWDYSPTLDVENTGKLGQNSLYC